LGREGFASEKDTLKQRVRRYEKKNKSAKAIVTEHPQVHSAGKKRGTTFTCAEHKSRSDDRSAETDRKATP